MLGPLQRRLLHEAAQGTLRVSDVADDFGLSRPVVCTALRKLTAKGLLRKPPAPSYAITADGRALVKMLSQSEQHEQQAAA